MLGLLIFGLLYHSNAFVLAVNTPSFQRDHNRIISVQLLSSMNPQQTIDSSCRQRRPVSSKLRASELSISTRGGSNDTHNDSLSKKSKRIQPISSIRNWYMNQLEAHELRTKFVSSGILALVGDLIAQGVDHAMSKSSSGALLMKIDRQRMFAMFMDGMICTGPLLHYVYEFYEWILPTHDKDAVSTDDKKGTPAAENNRMSSKSKFLAALAHVLLDNFVMVFVYIALLMMFTGTMEARYSTISDAITEVRNELLPSVKVSWKVSAMGYAPAQLLAFHFLPMKLRVLAVNCLDLIWVTVMSYVTHRNRH